MKKYLVCGLARSGFAAAKLLLSRGFSVTVADKMPLSSFKQDKLEHIDELSNMGAKFLFGQNPDSIVKYFDTIVISPGIPIDSEFIIKADSLAIPVIGEIELGYKICACPIAAITGTNGKTTAVTITGEIFKKCFPGSMTLGNIGAAFCEKAAEMKQGAWVALETSSFQLESVRDFRPKIAAVLNISEDHLNRHYTMEKYIKSKERIFAKQDATDTLVLNYDDNITRGMASRAKSRPAFFSMNGEPDPAKTGDSRCIFISGNDIVYRYKNYYETMWDSRAMRTPFKHILEDALAAALVAISAGADMKTISQTVLEFKGVEHRVELIAVIDDIEYYNDSKATNVDATVKALTAVEGKVILIAGGQDKKVDFAPLTSLFHEKVNKLVLFGETSKQIEKSCINIGFSNIESVSDLRQAVASAKWAAKPGDRVLLSPACASLDMFNDYEERGNLFKQYVNEV